MHFGLVEGDDDTKTIQENKSKKYDIALRFCMCMIAILQAMERVGARHLFVDGFFFRSLWYAFRLYPDGGFHPLDQPHQSRSLILGIDSQEEVSQTRCGSNFVLFGQGDPSSSSCCSSSLTDSCRTVLKMKFKGVLAFASMTRANNLSHSVMLASSAGERLVRNSQLRK
jgi:hypothetical protein